MISSGVPVGVKAEDGVGVEAGEAEFSQCRHVGQLRYPSRTADGERAQLAGLDVLDGDTGIEHEVELPGQQVVERGCGALIGHVNGVRAGHLLEHLGCQMR